MSVISSYRYYCISAAEQSHNYSNKVTSMNVVNVLWIRNCSAYSEPMMPYTLTGTAGSWRKLQPAAVGRYGRYIESMTSDQKSVK